MAGGDHGAAGTDGSTLHEAKLHAASPPVLLRSAASIPAAGGVLCAVGRLSHGPIIASERRTGGLVDEKRLALRDLLTQRPADIAEVLHRMAPEDAAELVRRLSARQAAAEPLGAMEPGESADLLARLDRDQAIGILSRMDPDDAVDLLEELPDPVQSELLSRLRREDAERLTELLAYDADTAGGLMSTEIITLNLELTVERTIGLLRQRVEDAETVYYAYTVNDAGHLQGVLSLRDLALAQPQTRLEALVNRDVIAVHVDTDAEDVANLFDKYDYYALPVVDDENTLLGIITIDDVLNVIRAEATEDIYGLASVPSHERVDSRWTASWAMRLPWLYLRLATALAAAAVVGLFEETIAKVAALAVLMGVIAGQGGSAGMQTVTILTRGMALGEVDRETGWRMLRKEFLLGIVNGALIGATVGIITYLWKGQLMLGVAAFAAMLLNLIIAGVTGVAIPLVVRFLGKDPALISGIFLTTMTDILGFGLLFLLAHLLLPGVTG
jgi:magnesium transporter